MATVLITDDNNERPISMKTRVSPQKNIQPDLIKMGIPLDIAERAESIYQVNSAKNPVSRKKHHIHFYCVFHAYKDLGIAPVPIDIAHKVNLPIKEITSALQLFPPRPSKDMTYEDYIATHCQKMGLTDDIKSDIIDFSKFLETSSCEEIDNKAPQTVAAGLISLYMSIHGHIFDLNNLSVNINTSTGSITSIQRKLSEILNTV